MNEHKIEMADIDSVSLHPENKIYTERDLESLIASIILFGLLDPLVISKLTGRILSGNRRWSALKALGRKQVPVRYIEVSEEEEKLCLISFNQYREKLVSEKLGEVKLIKSILENDSVNKAEVFKRFKLDIGKDKTTRQILSKIVGYSETYLSRLERISETNPELINLIDNGELSIHGAYQLATKKEKTPAPKKPKEPEYCPQCPYKKL